MVYITRGLATVLLDLAADAEPESTTAALAVSPARELTAPDGSVLDFDFDLEDTEDTPGADAAESDAPREGRGLTPDTPVFTDFYLPDAAGAVSRVFGVDLSTPPGQTQGRFVSHPDGGLEVEQTDDLHEAVFVAVPPWDLDSLAAFERDGRRRPLEVIDAHPPTAFAPDGSD